jgi:hypothetical protein
LRSDSRRPDYGALLNMLGGDMTGAKGRLLALHHARNEETEFSHPGSPPTEETITTARTNFAKGVTILVGVLEKAAAAPGAGPA